MGRPMTARLSGMRKSPSSQSGALRRLEWEPICGRWMAFLSLSLRSLSLTVSETKQNCHSKHYSCSSNKEFMLHQSVRTRAFFLFLSLSVTARIVGSGEDPRADCVNDIQISECKTQARVKTWIIMKAEEPENLELRSCIKSYVDVKDCKWSNLMFALTVVAFACSTPSAAIYSNTRPLERSVAWGDEGSERI